MLEVACSCRGRAKAAQFLWYDPTNPEGVKPIVYNSQIEARAKVIRRPGSKFIPYDANVPIGTQIAAAQAASVPGD